MLELHPLAGWNSCASHCPPASLLQPTSANPIPPLRYFQTHDRRCRCRAGVPLFSTRCLLGQCLCSHLHAHSVTWQFPGTCYTPAPFGPQSTPHGLCSQSSVGLPCCPRSVLPSASTLPLFDLRAQAEVSRLFDPGQHMRGFNPSLVEYNGTVFHVLRACNYTKCPPHVGLHFGRDQLALPVETKVAQQGSAGGVQGAGWEDWCWAAGSPGVGGLRDVCARGVHV